MGDSIHPFRLIREGILHNRPDGISDHEYAILCEVVRELDEDKYHVDLDGGDNPIAGEHTIPIHSCLHGRAHCWWNEC